MRNKTLRIKNILFISYFSITIPALILLLVLTFYTFQRQVNANTEDYQNRLLTYSRTMHDILERSEFQLNNITAPGAPFQTFHYGDSQLEKHQAAFDVMQTPKALITQESLLGGFFLYSTDFNYYYPTFQMNYNHQDQLVIKDFLTKPEHPLSERNRWIPLELSDRTVLLRLAGFDNTICAVMVDPALDEAVAAACNPSQDTLLFYASSEGTPFTSKKALAGKHLTWTNESIQILDLSERRYQLIKTSLTDYDLQLCYMIPYKGMLAHLNFFQLMLLFILILLLLSMSLIWVYLYKKLLSPINTLMDTMTKVGNGDLSLRAQENQSVLELQNFSQTFNLMLQNIHSLKLESYEKKLDIQQAQLQYLQLQIRPHFYLNCLKGLYGMAGKGQYREIQESILALSDYFRYMFRNNKKLVTLSEELHSVTCYLELQKLYFSYSPELTMDISADVVDVSLLPLSILTFVENSVKHTTDRDKLTIHIKAVPVATDTKSYLNIRITDNCGGFSAEILETLNHLNVHDFLYRDYHVGIYNIYYRLNLTYGEEATLLFCNIPGGGCVDLFIPIHERL